MRLPKLRLSVAFTLLMSGCSSTAFLYNRLDFLLPLYVDDYVELSREQKQSLDRTLNPFLEWHRKEELPRYREFLGRLEESLDRPLVMADAEWIFGEVEVGWQRLEKEALRWMLDLGTRLSEQQITVFLSGLRERQRDLQHEYLPRTDLQFREDSYDSLMDNFEDYLGSLNHDQRTELKEASSALLRIDVQWLEERSSWLTKLEVLLQREPGWQDRLTEAVVSRQESAPAQYRESYAQNITIIKGTMIRVLNNRTPEQDRRLRKKAVRLKRDLNKLVQLAGESRVAGLD
ncbi:MAG: hypothetical protein HOC23_05520 [Halieaceae bacterium]|nr:hypothetical protein [Halieaceae bacterium]